MSFTDTYWEPPVKYIRWSLFLRKYNRFLQNGSIVDIWLDSKYAAALKDTFVKVQNQFLKETSSTFVWNTQRKCVSVIFYRHNTKFDKKFEIIYAIHKFRNTLKTLV